MRMRDALQLYFVAFLAVLMAPFGFWSNRKMRRQAARRQQFYKEMYRGKYGY